MIDVWLENEKVGTFSGVPARGREIPSEFPILNVSVDATKKFGAEAARNLNEIEQMHWIQVGRRHREIEESELERMGVIHRGAPLETIARHYGIPADAEQRSFQDMMSMSRRVRFTWYVATPTLDQLEIMFDLPEFEPH